LVRGIKMKILTILMLFCWQCAAFCATQNLQKITVILDWFVNPDHAPLFVAQQQGYYRDENLDVEFITPADPADPPKLVAAGKADIAIDYQPHYLLEVAQGLPLTQVGTLVNQPLSTLTVLADSPVRTIKDLKGKTIGISLGSGFEEAMLKVMLEHDGLTLQDVQLIHVGYSLTQSLLLKKVDAVGSMLRNVELIQIQLEGHPGRSFYPEQNGFPSYAEFIFVAKNTSVNDPRVAAFLRAVQKSVIYLKQHPEESWQLFAKQHPELNNEMNKKSWFATVPYFDNEPAKLDETQCVNLAAVLNKELSVKIPESACKDKKIKLSSYIPNTE
jgi:putative hydroxymethylpyrimidine transport system substrate-binding protein